MRYQVEFEHPKGSRESQVYSECKDAGMAFAKCQKEHPDCRMVHAVGFSGLGPMRGEMKHEYPSPVQRDFAKPPHAARALKPGEALESVMPFYDKVVRR